MTDSYYHESPAELSPAARDRHRALNSLGEELEAVDWYEQRLQTTANAELRAILQHNRDEEVEHAAMLIEWPRRTDGVFDRELREYLFTQRPLGHEAEEEEDADEAGDAPASPLAGAFRTRGAHPDSD
ncbi:MAG: encapsulin-associated ferritin-like protein [Planctomycetota bacterium]